MAKVKKAKPKKKVRKLSKTELKLKYKQSNLQRKSRVLERDFDTLSEFVNPSQIITFKGKKAKVRTHINNVLNEIKKVNNDKEVVKNKRVKLTRGKYKPKPKIEATDLTEVINTPELDLYSEYNIWNYNDCVKDVLTLTNQGYTVEGKNPEEDYLAIVKRLKELFKGLTSEDTLYLYKNETNLDLQFAYSYD